MKKWEYLVIQPECLDAIENGVDMDKIQIDILGSDGWELVTIIDDTNTYF